MALLPNFTFHRSDGAKVWVDGKFATPSFVKSLAHAERWFDDPSCQIVKSQEKIRVGRLKIKIANVEHTVYLKQYKSVSLRHWLGSYFELSRAFRALRGAAILHAAQVSIATPFAAVEKRTWGALVKSFFVTQEVVGGKTTDAFWLQVLRPLRGRDGFERRRSFLRGLADLFRSLHARHIYHDDLKDANILTVANAGDRSVAFFLLDIEGVKRYSRLSEKRRIKNLAQLYRTLGRHVSASLKLYFLKEYLGPLFRERGHKRRLISKVLRRSRRLDARKERLSAEAVKSAS
ncbi:MAG TPA: lipopolysaccharide kinase InaA family protein [Candidatus Binatia bacterium]|nr:lipopolysaccharide kinase InaA family protein [Candidatus Binatia bacterium]